MLLKNFVFKMKYFLFVLMEMLVMNKDMKMLKDFNKMMLLELLF